eukprot:m51a1_g6472 hypothetical protein (250) ;mRNA; r:69731-70776
MGPMFWAVVLTLVLVVVLRALLGVFKRARASIEFVDQLAVSSLQRAEVTVVGATTWRLWTADPAAPAAACVVVRPRGALPTVCVRARARAVGSPSRELSVRVVDPRGESGVGAWSHLSSAVKRAALLLGARAVHEREPPQWRRKFRSPALPNDFEARSELDSRFESDEILRVACAFAAAVGERADEVGPQPEPLGEDGLYEAAMWVDSRTGRCCGEELAGVMGCSQSIDESRHYVRHVLLGLPAAEPPQ